MALMPTAEAVQPSLFIGLGATGISCLELIRHRLPSNQATGVRLLGIRMDGGLPPSIYANSGFDSENLIEIAWDRDQASRVVENVSGYEWWSNYDSIDLERLDARMAFHVMQYFYQDMRLSQYLRDTVHKLVVGTDNPLMLFVIASLQEVESAFFGDVIVEVLRQIPNLSVRLPCLLLDLNNDERGAESQSRAWAALREIERFTKKGQLMCGLPPEWGKAYVTKEELFNHILLLDNASYLPALADQLTSLVEKKVAVKFSNDYGNLSSQAQFSMTVSRSCTYVIPAEEIRGVCAVRLLKEELLDATCIIGGKVNTYVMDFLRGDTLSPKEWKFFSTLVDALDRSKKIDGYNWSDIVHDNSFRELFNMELCRFLNSKFQGTIKDFNNFLVALQENVSQAIDECDRRGGGLDGIILQKPQIQGMIKDFINEVSQWSGELVSLKSLLEQHQRQLDQDIQSLMKETAYRRILLRHSEKQADILDFESAYYADLRESTYIWQELVGATRKLLIWEWVSQKSQKPFLKCRINKQVYSKAQHMFIPLWQRACQLINQQSNPDSIFDFLSRLNSQEIKAAFYNAPLSIQHDPYPATRRDYLICTDDPMINDWNLPSNIQYCQIDDKERLTYLRLDYNLPIYGASFNKTYKAFLESAKETDLPFVFPHEQHAWRIEQKMKAKGISGHFPAQFVRLMHKAEDFDLVMKCIFWGWIDFKEVKKWSLDMEGETPISLDAGDIEKAIFNFLIHFPFEDMGGLHPLSVSNFSATMALLRRKNEEYRNRPQEQRRMIYERLQKKIDVWQYSKNLFEQGLALYQKYLLAQEDDLKK